jgi:prophage regulatory protein
MHDEILRFKEVHKVTSLSRTTIWRKERDGTFPSRRKISTNCVGWLRSQVEDWVRDSLPVIASHVEASRKTSQEIGSDKSQVPVPKSTKTVEA